MPARAARERDDENATQTPVHKQGEGCHTPISLKILCDLNTYFVPSNTTCLEGTRKWSRFVGDAKLEAFHNVYR